MMEKKFTPGFYWVWDRVDRQWRVAHLDKPRGTWWFSDLKYGYWDLPNWAEHVHEITHPPIPASRPLRADPDGSGPKGSNDAQ